MDDPRIELWRAGPTTTVLVDGHPQSSVNLDDPSDLEFEYIQHLALVLDVLTPAPPAPLAITHLGGGGLSLPRYLAVRRPGSSQVVCEPDTALTDLVRRELPLPRGHRIRVRPVDGRTGVAALTDASADALILDAYTDARVPPELTTLEAITAYRRVLASDGLFLANLADEPPLRYIARVAATVRAVFGHAALIGVHDVLKGRRFGNVVLLGSAAPVDEPAIATGLARRALGARLRGHAATARWSRSARPLTDLDASASPPAPDLGQWRVR